ncbi:MAG: hypothetical protein A2Z62_02350 [Candidatus Terrybacteria bacterium RIFCSPLOWO2_02_42_20]|uniref:Uncharacterized protein n=1 Tax=Candidatus Terrybacteria bacterium RIFCSPLOWO2_02_42_20 TaxID=1802370 RepID=A0A1G2Q0B0_9BACT|nr:MAG: hypothetical protein A2Z62_02350 [Candidatus Terrybacteria bacterium RIFCSPLOWO2_02_42_20]
MNKFLGFNKIVAFVFFAVFLVAFLTAGMAQADARQYTLKVKISGIGKITGIGESNGINCAKLKEWLIFGKYAGTCKAKFNKGDSVILTSEAPEMSIPEMPERPLKPEVSAPEKPPVIDSAFVGWGGACKVEKASVCSVTMDGNKKVSAKFKKIPSPKPLPIEISSAGRSQLKPISQELPFGISNPYSQEDIQTKKELPSILRDLGLSQDENGIAGFIVDEIARRHIEKKCNTETCQEYDFSDAQDLIDLVVGQGKANLWVVLGSPSNYKFTDGKIRKNEKTYLPDGPISRQAYKDYLTEMVNFVNSYGKKVSGNSNWYVSRWNLYNEVSAEYKSTFGKKDEKDVDSAAVAYANFVIDSSEILRKLSPQSKIVLAGTGSGTDLEGGHGEFYRLVFSKLKQSKLAYEPFDYWESHWFGEFKNYKTNEKDYGAGDFVNFLRDNGYGDKEFVIRAGGTYSGQDLQEREGLMNNYQSEQDQAEFLIKRFIYNLAHGVKKIPWSTIYERDNYQGETHVQFQYISLIYDGYPDDVSKNQKCVKGWLPCPDPGRGVKKLSYYTYKFLIEKLNEADFNDIKIINTNIPNVYLYQFNKEGKPVFVAWRDWWAQGEKGETKQITLTLPDINVSRVKITEAVPNFQNDFQSQSDKLREADYPGFFDSISVSVGSSEKITVSLGKEPVYIEAEEVLPEEELPIAKAGTVIPFGVNNPFAYPETDSAGEDCLKNSSVFKKKSSYSEKHIEIDKLKKCLPVAVSYMNNIKDIGLNVISQYFNRKYDASGMPYFGIEERNNEVTIQLYVKDSGNYFWAAINPVSTKGFKGDIDAKTHQILKKDEFSKKGSYLPASEAGFAEWQKWLGAVFDYLNDHDTTNNLVYIQIGNESDSDYAKTDKIERDNPDDFYWSAYAKLAEKSYDIIKSRSPKTKIVIGASGAGSITIDGFQRPVLEYLADKIDETGKIANGSKKCGGSGCFDVYAYNNYSGYKEYKGRTVCQPRNCVNPILTFKRSPENMKKLLSDTGFPDKKMAVQQGGTYTGQDSKTEKMESYQSEEDQASYLVKGGIYLLANGVEQSSFSTYIEHLSFEDTIHNWFTMMGLTYNGIPKKGECDGQLPCPDPGRGVKKLSYYSYKKLIEVSKEKDWNSISAITTGMDDVYLYKLTDKTLGGKAIYFAWWDWWKKCPQPDNSKPEMDSVCLDKNRPTVTINVGKDIASIEITALVPKFDTGQEVEKTGYTNAFASRSEETKEGIAKIILGTKPVYVK